VSGQVAVERIESQRYVGERAGAVGHLPGDDDAPVGDDPHAGALRVGERVQVDRLPIRGGPERALMMVPMVPPPSSRERLSHVPQPIEAAASAATAALLAMLMIEPPQSERSGPMTPRGAEERKGRWRQSSTAMRGRRSGTLRRGGTTIPTRAGTALEEVAQEIDRVGYVEPRVPVVVQEDQVPPSRAPAPSQGGSSDVR